MSLWVDKYRPRELSKLDHNKKQAKQLENLAAQNDFPHLMFYGPSGSGKKTRIMCLLRELYGPSVDRLRSEVVNFITPSNRKVEIITTGSNYHLEINPSDAGIYDRTVIIDIIKQVAQTHQIDPNGQREFKVIVLSEVDELTKDAQHALRRTMEKYVATCRIMLLVNSISRIIPAIRSRCLCIRVSAPTVEQISSILINTCKKENLKLPEDFARTIAIKSERNLRRALLMTEACKVQQYPFYENQKIPELDWQVYLRETSNQIVTDQTTSKLEKIRERLYELLSQGLPCDMIFKKLVENLVKICDFTLKSKTIEYACVYEHRMRTGSKHIFHLEAFVVQFMKIYKKYISDSNLMDDF